MKSFNNKKILVTGGAGFIGYHLTKSLLDDGFEVFGIDNLNDYYDVNLKYARLKELGNHRSEELMDVVHLIEENLGKKAIINFQPMQPGDVKESFADIEKSTKLLGYKPTTNVDVGIGNFINWYKCYWNKSK